MIGMTIAEDVYDNSRLIIPKDTVVNNEVLEILRFSSVIAVSVYGKEDTKETISPTAVQNDQPTHSERVRNLASFQKFEKTFHQTTGNFTCQLNDIANRSNSIDLDALFASASEMMAGETNTYQLMDFLSNIQYFDDSTYAHSLNVAMIANILGRWLHFNDEDLKIITVAGMLHDIGKLLVPSDIIKKPGRLTKEEFDIMKQHPYNGYKLLIEHGTDERIAQAALLHHEKCDGSGYPFGLKGYKINNLAKLITIADIYEAMTANRCYRAGICPFEVIKMYEEEGYQKYEPKYLITFLQGISDTYLHNTILLNDDRQGEIIMTNKTSPSRPFIKVDNEFIDLSRRPDLNIVSIL